MKKKSESKSVRANIHKVSWKVTIDPTGPSASYALDTNDCPPGGADTPKPGDVKVHSKKFGKTDKLTIEYFLADPVNYSVTCFQFVQIGANDDPLGGANFIFKNRTLQDDRFSFEDERSSVGTWKLSFSVRHAGKQHLIDPEITNTEEKRKG